MYPCVCVWAVSSPLSCSPTTPRDRVDKKEEFWRKQSTRRESSGVMSADPAAVLSRSVDRAIIRRSQLPHGSQVPRTLLTRPAPHPPIKPPEPSRLLQRTSSSSSIPSSTQSPNPPIERFPYVSMDTEFPGVIHHPPPAVHHSTLTASQRYTLLKSNVDALHLIQVGLAFAPSPSSPPALAFQINLREFDPRVHRHAPDSLRLLAASGVDLAAHRARGVSARAFAALLMSSGLVCNPDVAWVTFCSAYDFAYLVKVLMGRKLPRALPEFLRIVRVYFGAAVYDVKHMASEVALLGGLERVAGALRVRRAAGRGHQAASDSVLTWDTFREMARLYFPKEGSLEVCAGVLYGLELHDGGDATTKPAKCAVRC